MFNTRSNKKVFANEFKALLRQGKNTTVVSIVTGKALAELEDDTKTTLLHLAARYNNLDMTKYLVNLGMNVNATNDCGTTPLMMAASASSFRTAQFLLDENAEVYAIHPSNKSALQILFNNKKSPRYIIDKCFDRLKSISRSNQELAGRLMAVECPIKLLIYLHNSEVLEYILKSIVTDVIDPQQFQPALDVALRLKDDLNVKVLLQFGADIDIKNPDSLQFLSNMFKNPAELDPQLLIVFLMKIKNWNELEESYLFFLEGIFEKASKPVLEIFLFYKVDTIVRTLFPGRDLFVHIFANHNPGVRHLLPAVFNVNSQGERGVTALHLAVKNADIDDVKFLLTMGADPNIEDTNGSQPLSMIFHGPANENRKACIELLLKYGANPQFIGISGDTLIDMAVKSNDSSLLEPILAQIAVLQVSGVPIVKLISDRIDFYESIKPYYLNCCMQLEFLKKFLVYGSVTLFTVIVEDIERYAQHIPYPQVIESLRHNINCYDWHFMYRSKIDEFFNLSLEIISLKSKATLVMSEAIQAFSNENTIIGRILSYLTYEDLLKFA